MAGSTSSGGKGHWFRPSERLRPQNPNQTSHTVTTCQRVHCLCWTHQWRLLAQCMSCTKWHACMCTCGQCPPMLLSQNTQPGHFRSQQQSFNQWKCFTNSEMQCFTFQRESLWLICMESKMVLGIQRSRETLDRWCCDSELQTKRGNEEKEKQLKSDKPLKRTTEGSVQEKGDSDNDSDNDSWWSGAIVHSVLSSPISPVDVNETSVDPWMAQLKSVWLPDGVQLPPQRAMQAFSNVTSTPFEWEVKSNRDKLTHWWSPCLDFTTFLVSFIRLCQCCSAPCCTSHTHANSMEFPWVHTSPQASSDQFSNLLAQMKMKWMHSKKSSIHSSSEFVCFTQNKWWWQHWLWWQQREQTTLTRETPQHKSMTQGKPHEDSSKHSDANWRLSHPKIHQNSQQIQLSKHPQHKWRAQKENCWHPNNSWWSSTQTFGNTDDPCQMHNCFMCPSCVNCPASVEPNSPHWRHQWKFEASGAKSCCWQMHLSSQWKCPSSTGRSNLQSHQTSWSRNPSTKQLWVLQHCHTANCHHSHSPTEQWQVQRSVNLDVPIELFWNCIEKCFKHAWHCNNCAPTNGSLETFKGFLRKLDALNSTCTSSTMTSQPLIKPTDGSTKSFNKCNQTLPFCSHHTQCPTKFSSLLLDTWLWNNPCQHTSHTCHNCHDNQWEMVTANATWATALTTKTNSILDEVQGMPETTVYMKNVQHTFLTPWQPVVSVSLLKHSPCLAC